MNSYVALTFPARIAALAIVGFFIALGSASDALAGVPPVIDSVTASAPSVVPGGTLRLTVQAHDPDCTSGVCTAGCGLYVRSDLTAWSTVAGSFVARDNGTSASPYTAYADWQAPTAEGAYTIGVTLADSGTWMCGGRNSVSGRIDVLVTTSTNRPPAVTSVTATPAQLLSGQTSRLTCAASDPDGDAISYGWSTDSGTLTASGDTATFAGGQPGIATVTCTATDPKGASGTGTVRISMTDATAQLSIRQELDTPMRLAADSLGDLYVADRRGIAAFNLADGSFVYRIELTGATSVAVDWQDRLVVGTQSGARLLDRLGRLLAVLDPGEPLGPVSDVAVDAARRRIAVLHGDSSRIVLYGDTGARVSALGQPGDGAAEFRRPQGIAFTPQGDVVVADSGHATVKILGADGTLRSSFGGTGNGAGRFVRLDDVEVDADGVIYTSDAYQSWVQSFNPDGTLREVLGTYGDSLGQLKTPAGIAAAGAYRKLAVASLNTPSLELFRTKGEPVTERLPQPSLSTAALVFPVTTVGATSPTQDVVLTNSGSAPLGIRGVSVNGEFTQSNDCGPFLYPGMACVFRVTFAPETTGPASGALRVETSAMPGLQTVALAGQAVAAPAPVVSASVLPDRLVFGDQRVGSTSAPQLVTLRSTGTAALAVRGVRASEGFGFAQSCPGSLAPGASCVVSVSFAPLSTGPTAGALVIDTDAVNGPLSVALTGKGIPRGLEAEPDAIDFGTRIVRTRTKPRLVTLANRGPEPIAIAAVELAGDGARAFRVERDVCSGATVAPGASCTLRVRFRPLDEGSFFASLRVATPSEEARGLVALSGIGTLHDRGQVIFEDDFESGDLSRWTTVVPEPPLIELGRPGPARAAAITDVPVGERGLVTVKVVNRREAAVAVTGVVLEGDGVDRFSIDRDVCSGAEIESGASCTVSVIFAPRQAGRATVSLGILGDGEPATLVVTGESQAEPESRRR